MSSVTVAWNGRCRDPQSRYRLLSFLHRLGALSDAYLRAQDPARPRPVAIDHRIAQPPRPNIDSVDRRIEGTILVASDIIDATVTFPERAQAAGLQVLAHPDKPGLHLAVLERAHLRGIDLKLYDPRRLYPGADRMSFIFLECPDTPLLDGRLVRLHSAEDRETHPSAMIRDAQSYLSCPQIQLRSYLEDWTDCLFSWMKFFFIGDLWWQRWEELQGYNDYRGVFSDMQKERGREAAEEATFDAVLATFAQHAEHWNEDVEIRARSNGR